MPAGYTGKRNWKPDWKKRNRNTGKNTCRNTDVLPGEEQLRRIEAIADPYAMRPQNIMEEQESRRELYYGLKRLTQREQTYLLYRYGFTDGEEHLLIGTAIYFHLTKGRAKKTEEQAMDNLWLELPWWFD